ncbi:hypothetical protein VB796_13105 [Arcicella sp. LKC2W]|uniref:hypothetical protein n=1 Tax=Arcicella sp. LKC2W TaxID=2984198 RepID=UPI002B20179F|nr:hypothetical protein [Arcicella sp. LKC2W]MEA5459987.1 hypothetical protein [Arcicella sp. LKC2W]
MAIKGGKQMAKSAIVFLFMGGNTDYLQILSLTTWLKNKGLKALRFLYPLGDN